MYATIFCYICYILRIKNVVIFLVYFNDICGLLCNTTSQLATPHQSPVHITTTNYTTSVSSTHRHHQLHHISLQSTSPPSTTPHQSPVHIATTNYTTSVSSPHRHHQLHHISLQSTSPPPTTPRRHPSYATRQVSNHLATPRVSRASAAKILVLQFCTTAAASGLWQATDVRLVPVTMIPIYRVHIIITY